MPRARRVVVGPREALRTSRMRLRDVNWLGDGTHRAGAGGGRGLRQGALDPAAAAGLAARRCRRGIEVELVAGEDGVSPGQACVFYDAAEGQARVLGGGIIAERGARAREDRQGAAVAGGRRAWPTMAAELDKDTVAKAYARWAPVYDLVFGAVFDRGRKASIAAAERIGGRILDVGVGTGISLPDYSRTNRIVGVDFSEPMLRKAKERVAEHRLTNVDALAVMDAQHLGFPGRLLRRGGGAIRHHRGAGSGGDARRVRPRAQARRRDHPGQPSRRRGRPARAFEQWFAPLARRLGWRPEFRWERLAQWAAQHGGVRVVERRPMPPLGHFSLIRFGRARRRFAAADAAE